MVLKKHLNYIMINRQSHTFSSNWGMTVHTVVQVRLGSNFGLECVWLPILIHYECNNCTIMIHNTTTWTLAWMCSIQIQMQKIMICHTRFISLPVAEMRKMKFWTFLILNWKGRQCKNYSLWRLFFITLNKSILREKQRLLGRTRNGLPDTELRSFHTFPS